MLENILSLFIAYLIGAIPFGFILAKIFAKTDIRKKGSGNIGATNIVRTLGKKLGYLTFALDASKAIISLILIRCFFKTNDPLLDSLIVLFSIIGHIYPYTLKFKGGKGVATLFGSLLFLEPLTATFLAVAWYIIFYITRMVSLASITLMLEIIFFYIITFHLAHIGFVLSAILIIYKHKDNIQRIMKGEEHKF